MHYETDSDEFEDRLGSELRGELGYSKYSRGTSIFDGESGDDTEQGDLISFASKKNKKITNYFNNYDQLKLPRATKVTNCLFVKPSTLKVRTI